MKGIILALAIIQCTVPQGYHWWSKDPTPCFRRIKEPCFNRVKNTAEPGEVLSCNPYLEGK